MQQAGCYHYFPLLQAFNPEAYLQDAKEAWNYWFNASLSGSQADPSSKQLRKPGADPVVKASDRVK